MAKSQRYRELRKRINELKRHLLPKNLSPTGNYSDRQIDRTCAFRLLVHSEIEAFIEDRAKNIALEAFRQWKDQNKASKVLMCLLAYSEMALEGPPDSTRSQKPDPLIIDRLRKALSHYLQKLNTKNNGIKEKNILQLLIPIGIQLDEIDPAWLSSMDSFGSKRGDVAHQSRTTYQPPDPSDEISTINDLLNGIEDIDEKLNQLL